MADGRCELCCRKGRMCLLHFVIQRDRSLVAFQRNGNRGPAGHPLLESACDWDAAAMVTGTSSD